MPDESLRARLAASWQKDYERGVGKRKLPDAPRDQLMFAPPMTHASRDYLDEFGRPSGILRGYSILAWIELRFPGLPVVFVHEGLEGEAPTDHVWICFKNTD